MRPLKEGLDYFELDCQMDEKIELIEAEFGLKGFAIIVKLFQYIYGTHGYYCEWTPDISLLWASRNCGSSGGVNGSVGKVSEEGALSGFQKNFINEIIAASIRRGVFSAELFEKYHILTSAGIQKRYTNAVARRNKVTLKREYLLIEIDENKFNVINNSVNVNNNSVNDGRSTQSREEKSRVENNPPTPLSAKRHKITAYECAKQQGFPTEVEKTVLDWLKYKKERGQGYKPTGWTKLLKQIENNIQKHGEQAVIDVINLSISQNYQGITWSKLNQASGGSRQWNTQYYEKSGGGQYVISDKDMEDSL